MAINFMSSKGSKETGTMYSRNDNMIETTIGNEKDEILEERFDFLLQKYQNCLEESMKGSKFVF